MRNCGIPTFNYFKKKYTIYIYIFVVILTPLDGGSRGTFDFFGLKISALVPSPRGVCEVYYQLLHKADIFFHFTASHVFTLR